MAKLAPRPADPNLVCDGPDGTALSAVDPYYVIEDFSQRTGYLYALKFHRYECALLRVEQEIMSRQAAGRTDDWKALMKVHDDLVLQHGSSSKSSVV